MEHLLYIDTWEQPNRGPQIAVMNFTPVDTVYRRSLRTVSLKYQRLMVNRTDCARAIVKCPHDACEILRAIFERLDDDQEHFVILVLKHSGEVSGYKVISSGAQGGAMVDAKLVFRNALMLGAASIIMAHNHPSDNPLPSHEDIELTRRFVSLGAALEMPVNDHIIMLSRGWVSINTLYPEMFV